MVVEIVGNTLRIIIESPDKYTSFRTQDIGKPGRLSRIAGYSERTGWETQSFRLNIKYYKNKEEIIKEIKKLRISKKLKREAISKL